MNPGQTQLLILLVSIVAVYYFYPEYIGIVAPLFVAITLYFASNEMIISMFSIIPVSTTSITDFIIKYKLYIIIALATISAYYTTLLLQDKKHKSESTDTIDSSDFNLDTTSSSKGSSKSTEYLPPTPNPSSLDALDTDDLDRMDGLMSLPKSSKLRSRPSKVSRNSGLQLLD